MLSFSNMPCKQRLRCGLLFLFGLLLSVQDTAIAKDVKAKKEGKETVVVSPLPQEVAAVKLRAADVSKESLQKELAQENALNRALLEKKLAGIMAQIEQLRLEKERRRLSKEAEEETLQEAHNKAMQSLRMEKEKLVMELELAQARFAKKMEQYSIQLAELEKEMQLKKGQAQLLQETKNHLQAEIEVLNAKTERSKCIETKPTYLKNPLRKKDNVLVLSDRCVKLDGCITSWKANYIVDQIQFFNNKNSFYPIFLVIGRSPGGEVFGLFNILQAIEHSKAPVYVVVREYAASGAALIATLAPKSYALPNATILHHQPYNFSFYLNVREAEEFHNDLIQTWKRLGGRVAKKMGISLKALDAKLYQKNSSGDWKEYADQAKKLKWIDVVVNGIEESAVAAFPDAECYTRENYLKGYFGSNQALDKETSVDQLYGYPLQPGNFDYSYRPRNQSHYKLK
ncbi:ATP-dependent Clp protease proteolytic subunit [Candidatus Cardinium hertigii]|uniref:ATP-dependent Clp protease proteolytic subunit n=1 Tax=Candidatus Cardinium hertigii TaxID=247481 RepID=A0A2Z3LIF8_9BACT|nr:ATP-dependent Clp protease proteolytic subunit [Candidatus Cardinium hertigii]AWN82234.1 ATP-dependent Clp protease proteolytic subunit [Candidatus Cardinium hertigii]